MHRYVLILAIVSSFAGCTAERETIAYGDAPRAPAIPTAADLVPVY